MLVKLEWLGYRTVKKLWRYAKPFSSDTGTSRMDGQTDRQMDGQTDRRTELLYQYRASVCWRAIKTKYRCTTTNLPACNGTIIVLKITLYVSVITNSIIWKRDKQIGLNKQRKPHFFVYSRRETHSSILRMKTAKSLSSILTYGGWKEEIGMAGKNTINGGRFVHGTSCQN